MSSSISALTAGGGGVVTSADSSGNLNLQSGTTTILALTATGVAVTGTLTSSGVLSATSPTFVTPVINSATVATVSGTAPLYMCRAWVNFNGSGTVAIRASGNVSSITDLGVGNYRVNFTTAMVDANYSATIGWRVFASVNSRAGGFDNYTTGYIEVYGGYNGTASAFTAEDTTFVSVAILR